MIASRFTGRRVLLAVGALAVAAPAAVQIARVATSPSPRVVVVIVPQPRPVVIEMMQPRVMPTGAPACGNVTSRPIPGVEKELSMIPFELSWRGGATEARLHRVRPGIDELPWGTLDLSRYPDEHGVEARKVWSNGVFTEYASAAAFSALTTAMLQCGAPVDLVAMSADIVVDELFHVELSSRLTMELGGAVPLGFDMAAIAPVTTPGIRPLMRAAEIAVTTSCVSESLSVPAMARSRALAAEPLVHGVLARLLADEGPHARLGFWFLDWANEQLTDEERAHLARLAADTIEVYAPLWAEDAGACGTCPLPAGLGGHDAVGRANLRKAVDLAIAAPLARYGIELDRARLAAIA